MAKVFVPNWDKAHSATGCDRPNASEGRAILQGKRSPSLAITRHTKTECFKFIPGDCCRMPSGDRVFVAKALGNGRYKVTWEVGGAADEVSGRMLKLVAKGK